MRWSSCLAQFLILAPSFPVLISFRMIVSSVYS